MSKQTYVFLPGWGFSARCFDRLKAHLPQADTFIDCEYTDNNFERYCQKLSDEIPPYSKLIGWSLGSIVARKLQENRPDLWCFSMAEPSGLTPSAISSLKSRLKRSPHAAFKQFIRWQAGSLKVLKLCAKSHYSEPPIAQLDWLTLKAAPTIRRTSIIGQKDVLNSAFCQDKSDFIISDAGHSIIFTHPQVCAEVILRVSRQQRPATANTTQRVYFNQAATSYCEASDYQQDIAKTLLRLCSDRIKSHESVLDLGCGPSRLALNSIGVDFAFDSLAGQDNAVCADIQALPFYNQFDWIVSNMALHWCGDFESALKEIYQALKPSGRCIFSIPIQPSLHYLQSALGEKKNCFVFQSAGEIINFCRDKFEIKKSKKQTISVTFKTTRDLCNHFKKNGCALQQAGLFGRQTRQSLDDLIQKRGGIQFEILLLEAKKCSRKMNPKNSGFET